MSQHLIGGNCVYNKLDGSPNRLTANTSTSAGSGKLEVGSARIT